MYSLLGSDNIWPRNNYLNIWNMKYPNDFWHKRKIDNFDPYNVFLAIAINIPQQLKKTAIFFSFVVQGHILPVCRHLNNNNIAAVITM